MTATGSVPSSDLDVRDTIGAGAKTSASILSIMGSVWWLAAGSGVGGAGFATLALLGIGIGVALFVAARSLPNVAPRDPESTMRTFGRINLAQAVLILVLAIGLGRTGLPEFIPGAVAVVVGAHFIPFGRLFDWPTYRALGVGGIAIGAVGLIIGGLTREVESSLPFVGVAFGILLWVIASTLVRLGRTHRR